MKIKKITAFITAFCLCAAETGILNSNINLHKGMSAGAEVSENISETCEVNLAFVTADSKIPEGMTAKLVKCLNGVETVVDSWEITDSSLRKFDKLEYSDNISYKITIENIPDYYYYPESTDLIFSQDGHVDNVKIFGYYMPLYGFISSFKNYVDVNKEYIHIMNSGFSGTSDDGTRGTVTIIGEDGFRYCNNMINESSGIILPDGNYTVYTKLNQGYSFISPYSETYIRLLDFNDRMHDPSHKYSLKYNNGNGTPLEMKNGIASIENAGTYIIDTPDETNSCSVNISVEDEETGEKIDNVDLKFYSPVDDGAFRKSLSWNTSDYPVMSFDDLKMLNKDYIVEITYLPEQYQAKNKTVFKLSEIGEHQDIVIKAKRIIPDEELENIDRVILPEEDPVPDNDKCCALTFAVMNRNCIAPDEGTARLYKVDAENRTEELLTSWDCSKEPVKQITNIEFDSDARYYIKCSESANEMCFKFSEPGDTEKIVCIYNNLSYKNSIYFSVIKVDINDSVSSLSSENAVINIYDEKGYKYNPDGLKYSSKFSTKCGGILPDGEYTAEIIIPSNMRFIDSYSETGGYISQMYEYTQEYLKNNYESGTNNLKFTVKDGAVDCPTTFYFETVPTKENSNTLSVSVVDDNTGKPLEGIDLYFDTPSIHKPVIVWNTSDYSVMNFDKLVSHEAYSVSVIPKGDLYETPSVSKIKFDSYGEHKDVEIRIKRKSSDIKGDANCDTLVNMADTVLIMQYMANPSKYGLSGTDPSHITENGIDNSDVIGNDGVTNLDALEIQKFLLELVKEFS